MKYRNSFLLIGGLGIGFILGGLILWFGTPRFENKLSLRNPLPRIGSPIPDFELTDLNGKMAGRNEFQGKPLIINFWTTWCAPCKLELPLLQQTSLVYKKTINLIAVNPDESTEIINRYMTQNKFDLPVLMDEAGVMADEFGVHAFPVTYFVDKNGILQSMHVGQLDEKLMTTYLRTIGINE